MQQIMFIIVLNIIAFILFKTLINKRNYSYFCPFVLNLLVTFGYFVIILQGHGDINEIFCFQVLSYVGMWFCQVLSSDEHTEKGAYSLKEDVKDTLGVYGHIVFLTLLVPVVIVGLFAIGVYLMVREIKEVFA